MDQEAHKRAAAMAAIDYIRSSLTRDSIIGVGTGSTANLFIDALARLRNDFDAAVASSDVTAQRLRSHGINVLELNVAQEVQVYVDGADEANRARQLIKGGGGALTREKILAAASKEFVCIIDDSKLIDLLGGFPVAVEVVPMARGLAARRLVALGGQPGYRQGFITDNGNIILDVEGLDLTDPTQMEQRINNVVGVVSNGIFAVEPADRLIIAGSTGIETV
jgi:ribose 5-phosphate isomerase A